MPATTLREMGDGVGSTSVSALGADAGQEVRAPASVAAAESEVSLGAQRNETVAASEPPAEPRGVAPTSGSGARTLASAARADDRPGTADADPSLDVGSTGPVASDLVAAAPGVVAPTSVGSAGAAPSSPASAPVTSVADAQKAAENQAAARDANAAPARRAAPEQRLTSAITAEPALAAGVRARQAAPADADAGVAADEAVSLVVPGLEVLDVLPVGQGTTFAGMRALQRLEGGDTLELVHLPESVDPASLPPLRVGWSELVRERGAGWIVMRARLPQATLVELLQRLESGR